MTKYDADWAKAEAERRTWMAENSLYLPETEHDSCGVGLVAAIDGKPRRKVLEYGITALKAVWHRGAVDADGKTGDGAGIHVQIPTASFQERIRRSVRGRCGDGRVMVPGWRYFQRRLATACAICICATSASAAGAAFDYSVEPLRDAAVEGTSVIEPIDPERCGTDLGWIERLEGEFEARTDNLLSPVRDRFKLRKGLHLDYVTPGLDGTIISRTKRIPTTVTVQYTGCVTPTGRVLLSFEAHVGIEAHDAPLRFIVAYEGPPLTVDDRFSLWRSDQTLKNFEVETDLGDAVDYGLGLSWWPPLSSEQVKDFSISLRLKNQGDTE